MHTMTDPAGTSLVTFVDMKLMQIKISVSEFGDRGARIFGEPLGVTGKAESIMLRTVRSVETLRKLGIKERLDCCAMRIMTGSTFAILDRLVL